MPPFTSSSYPESPSTSRVKSLPAQRGWRVVKTGSGRICKVSVLSIEGEGDKPLLLADTTDLKNLVPHAFAAVPAKIGVYEIEWPFSVGLSVGSGNVALYSLLFE
jgi:hypothetical protein